MREYKIKIIIFLFVSLVLPTQRALAETSGLVYECVSGSGASAVYGNCSWQDLIAATSNLVNKLTVLAIGFSVIVIAWAGFKYMTSGGSPQKISEANGIFTKVAIGLGFIIGAWAIVTLILKGLGVTSVAFTP